jgi:hypothetical protein
VTALPQSHRERCAGWPVGRRCRTAPRYLRGGDDREDDPAHCVYKQPSFEHVDPQRTRSASNSSFSSCGPETGMSAATSADARPSTP